MARNGVDLRGLEQLQRNIVNIEQWNNAFFESCSKELAARLLAKTIRRTPVGVYSASSGKKGGTLRRGWTGQRNGSGSSYVQSLNVNKSGNSYIIEIINPVEYASYVEFGHRTRGNGWVDGRYMMTISADEIDRDAPRILERKIQKLLRGLSNDNKHN